MWDETHKKCNQVGSNQLEWRRENGWKIIIMR